MKNVFTYLLSLLLLAQAARVQTTDPVRQKLDNVRAGKDKEAISKHIQITH